MTKNKLLLLSLAFIALYPNATQSKDPKTFKNHHPKKYAQVKQNDKKLKKDHHKKTNQSTSTTPNRTPASTSVNPNSPMPTQRSSNASETVTSSGN